MIYKKLQEAITAMGYSLEQFACRCGIETGYFTRTLEAGADFTAEEYWAMALCLGIANNAEAQDVLFFEDDCCVQ